VGLSITVRLPDSQKKLCYDTMTFEYENSDYVCEKGRPLKALKNKFSRPFKQMDGCNKKIDLVIWIVSMKNNKNKIKLIIVSRANGICS